jgi:hypothetical protein
MFRANRIGTPTILPETFAGSAAVITAGSDTALSAEIRGNVINAAPVLDFGQNSIRWANTRSIATLQRICIGQQFTITTPITGDTVGLELMGSMAVGAGAAMEITPVLFKVTAAAGAVWGVVNATGLGFTHLAEGREHQPGRGHRYVANAIHRGATTPVAGTYFHGFQIYNKTGAALSITDGEFSFGVRQLNDQQDVSYRDTRR